MNLNLSLIFSNQVVVGLEQAAATGVLSLLVVLLAREIAVHIENETVVALVRGLIQVAAVGLILGLLLKSPAWTSVIILVGMVLAAAATAARRAKKIPGAFSVALYGIGVGSGLVILGMTLLGVIGMNVSSMVPIGSMIIANAMNTCALALERFRSDVQAHQGLVEASLALGADPKKSVIPYTQTAIQASLIPRIDSLRSLGIVWIPGLMAGMILSGTNPIYAGIYQFVTIAMIFAASGLTSVISTMLIRSHAFSPGEQLVLKA